MAAAAGSVRAKRRPARVRFGSEPRGAAAALATWLRGNALHPRRWGSLSPTLLRRAARFDLLHWPRKIAPEVRGRDVLDVGCGSGVEAIGFLAVGARSYTGVDPRLDLDGDRVKNQRSGRYEAFGVTPREVALRLGRVELARGSVQELSVGERFDLAVLHNVTEHLLEIEATFRGVAERLRPGGLLIFDHHSFSCWNGHHQAPRAVAEIDPTDPGQAAFVDWSHLTLDAEKETLYRTRLNRIRLDELYALTARFFAIESWEEKPADAPRGGGRLTREIRARHPEYSARELSVRAVECRARRRPA